ncbi:MAG TPA: hypothetical protein VIT38_00855 [Allosphingosinicella sp.]
MAEFESRAYRVEAERVTPAQARSGPRDEAIQRRAAAREAGYGALMNARTSGPQPIQAKKIWRDGAEVEVPDDHVLAPGEERFSPQQFGGFDAGRAGERAQEVGRLREGFVAITGGHGEPRRVVAQPPPRVRGHLGLVRSRFDTSGIEDEGHRDHAETAMAGTTHSPTHNRLVGALGDDLLGRMLRNANRAGNANNARQAFNASPPVHRQMPMIERPDRMDGAEDATLGVNVSQGTSPHFRVSTNSVSLMNPDQLDQTSHELRHAYDHIHGDLDLENPRHRIASELNAFRQQDRVSRETTGAPPAMFEGATPTAMARSYEGKEAKGYEGTLASSIEAGEEWRRRRGE